MPTAKIGCHARLREKHIPTYSTIYGPLDPQETYKVFHLDNGAGRRTVYLQTKEDPERLIPAWAGHVQPLPRCEYCDQEGHTKSKCKTTT